MAATKTPAKSTATKTNAAEAEVEATEDQGNETTEKAKRNITAKPTFEVVDDVPEGRPAGKGRGRSSTYLDIANRIAREASGKWVQIMTSGNAVGASNVRKNLTKRQDEGELPEGTWEFDVRRFDENTPFPGDASVRSALYVKHTA